MKNFYLIVLVFIFINSGFTSCSSDNDDDEVFFTEESVAKEMIKGKWTVSSLSIKSNYPAYDQEFNKASSENLKSNIQTMVFKDEFVESTTTSKIPNGPIPYSELDKYYFQSNTLYIEDLTYKMTLPHTYKVSDKTLLLISTLTRANLVKIFETDGIINGIDYTEVINTIPSNFSGNINYTLKR